MSLIICTDPCVYQKDGYCSLSRAASSGGPGQLGCVNFVAISSEPLQQNAQRFTDVGDPN